MKLPRFFFLILMTLLSVPVFSQVSKIITGQITEQGKGPMGGVTISIKGKTIASYSNPEGNFRIQAAAGDTLVFSNVGYQSLAVAILDQETINVTLSTKVSLEDEVIVIGYGTAKRGEFTGAASTINMDAMLKSPVGTFAEGLAGRAAGVQVSTQDGQPGAQSDIIIRGALFHDPV